MNCFLIPSNNIKLIKKFITGEISPSIWSRQEPSRKNLPTDSVELFIKPLCFLKGYQSGLVKSLIYPFKKDCIFFIHLFLDSEKSMKELDILTYLLIWFVSIKKHWLKFGWIPIFLKFIHNFTRSIKTSHKQIL